MGVGAVERFSVFEKRVALFGRLREWAGAKNGIKWKNGGRQPRK
jgi:hypothetical protein